MSYFTKKELDKIQAQAHGAMISRMGYCQSTSRAIIYGPKRYGGAGFFHLYDDQGYGQIRMFLKLWRSPTTQAGKLLRVVVSWAQFCVGAGVPILHDVMTPWPHFESKWLQSLRLYLRDVGGKIRLFDTYVRKLQRINDIHLMDVALSSKRFKPAALKRINYCRMYLNVILLSDITNPNGTHLDDAAYRGEYDDIISHNLGHRVNQAKPNEKAWKVWRKFLHLLCQRDAHHTLRTPLGAWTVPPNEYSHQWRFYFSTTEDRLYHNTALGITSHARLRHDFDREETNVVEHLPRDATPVQVSATQHTWILPSRLPKQDSIPILEPTHSIMETLETLPPWERDLLAGIIFLQPEDEVWTTLCSQQCTLASDGSAPAGRGAFAWILSNNKDNRLVRCNGPAFGYAISSYRAESYGIASILCFLVKMTMTHQGKELIAPRL